MATETDVVGSGDNHSDSSHKGNPWLGEHYFFAIQ
jgi:hypothetical protein